MKLATLRTLLLFVCLIAISGIGKAQINHEILDKPDTLSGVERLSLRTNMVDWTLLMPNIAVEYDLGKTTRNHWTAGLSIRGNWQTKHTYNPGLVFNVAEVRGEFRYYWRTRLVTEQIPKHQRRIVKKNKDNPELSDTIYKRNWWQQIFSCRRDSFMYEQLEDGQTPTYLKHPNTTYYRGFYASYNKYSIKLTQTGYQGSAVNAGFVYGIVKPLYQFANGNALDLDLGISAGLCMAKYDEYELDRESNCYPLIKKNDWKIVPFPVINEARVALVYRFSKDRTHQLGYRYRWRYDVDKKYRDAFNDSLAAKKERQRVHDDNVKNLGSLKGAYEYFYNLNYQKVLDQKRQEKNDAIEAKRRAEAEKAEKARQDKLKEQEARAQAKAEEQAQREAAKRAREEEKQAKKKKSSEETPAEQSPEVSEQPEEGKEAAQ